MIYKSLKQTLYSALIANLLFWRDLSGALRYWGFNTNPHEISVVKKTFDGKQCTICWHMHDLKISNVILKVVYGVLSQLTTEYRKVSPLSVRQVRVHH